MSKSCQIKGNNYYSPNGKKSQLHEDLVKLAGEEKAKELFVFAYSDKFPKQFSPIKKKGEYKSGNTVVTFGDYINPINNKNTGNVELKLIQTPEKFRGKGEARKAIKEFLAYTDSLKKDVVLTVSPRDKITTEKGLIDFYKSVGFVQSPSGFEMIRYKKPSIFDQNGEPKAIKVIELAREQNENTEPLSTAEKIDLQVQFPNFENSDDLLVELEKAFYKDGLFNPTKTSLTKRLYSNFEAENLLSNVTLLKQVKDSLERLKRTETVENSITLDEQFKSSDLNIFGKFKLLNPFIVKQDIIEEFGGKDNVDISEIIDKTITEDYLKEFKRIPVIDEEGNPVLNKVVYENASKIIEDLDNFDNLNEEQIVKKLLDYGIDTKGKVLKSLTIEDILALNNDAPQREVVIKIGNQERDLVYLETLKTEEQLFNELNLIQSEIPNVYHRVEKVDELELRNFLKAKDNVAEYQLYKNYYGYDTTSFTTSFTASPVETDIDYLKGEFVADFNAEILKNPEHEFYNKFEANEKGIILKYDDPISISQIKAYISDNVKLGKELADYSVISKNMPNFKEESFFENNRVSAVNNKNSLKKPTTQVTLIDKNTLLAKNEIEPFINYNNEVYELKNKEGNDSVYIKLNTIEDLNYFQTEVNTQDYVDQIKIPQQKLEKYNEVKKLYKEEDLEDKFNCIS